MSEQPSSQELSILQQSLFERCDSILAQDGIFTRRVTQQGDIFEGVSAQRTILIQMPWTEERISRGTFTISRETYLGRDQSQPMGVTVLGELHSPMTLNQDPGQGTIPHSNIDSFRRRMGDAMPNIDQSAIVIDGCLDWLIHPEIFEPHHEEYDEEDYTEDYAWKRDVDFDDEGYIALRGDEAKIKVLRDLGIRGGLISSKRDLTEKEITNLSTALDSSVKIS